MALDRTYTAIPYVTGRMIAITEHYAGKKFGPNTLSTMFQHPAHTIGVFSRYIDKEDEYYIELLDKGIDLPVTTVNEVVKSQMWVGYYHQKYEYSSSNDRQFTRIRIGQRIAQLRKEAGMTQEELSIRAGLQRTHVCRIEAGKYAVTLEVVQAIAEALGKTVDIIDPDIKK